MRIDRTFLHSRVARRIVALFVLSALLPVLVMGWLAYAHLRDTLIDQGHLHLAQLSESYATGVYERLLVADNQIRTLFGNRTRRPVASPEVEERLRRQFRSIAIVDAGGTVEPVVGARPEPLADGPGAAKHLASGATMLVLGSAGGAVPGVFLVRSLVPGRADASRLVAMVDPLYLWGEFGAVPPNTAFSVFSEDGHLLHDSSGSTRGPMHAGLAQRQGATGRFRFEDQGAASIADYRELFLAPRFLTQGWIFVAARPEAQVLATIDSFAVVLVPVMLLAVLIVALLSVNQIRRTLGPLEKLIEGTRRAADQDFSARVDVHAKDEFGELAASFNSMAARLGRQFNVLMTLSEIDRAILSRLDIDRVLETVVMRMGEIVPAQFVSIGVRDRDAGSMLRMYSRDQRAAGALCIDRAACEDASVNHLLAHREGRWIGPEEPLAAYAESVRRLGATTLFVLPIVWQDAVVGVVLLGFDGKTVLSTEDEARAQNLGDRVGVAFATAAKDEQLYFQAHYDALTRLPNRLYFKDQLARRLAQAQRDRKRFALLFIDLDHFKTVNDSLGHAVGDDVLRQAADRLRSCVREADAVARLGGDEFTVVLPEIRTARDADVVSRNIIKAMRRPFTTGSHEHFLNASIGIAIYPADGATVDDLLRNADAAMYKAKDAGRGRAVYFEDRMNAAAQARVDFERDMRHAIARDEFVLHYQPQVTVRDGTICGAEALVRWQHPQRGLLSASHFVPLAEETGLIDGIGEWVLRESCRQFMAWRQAGVRLPRIAVNVSPRQFRQRDFPGLVARVLAETAMPASHLELEITESLLMDSSRQIEVSLSKLARLGVRIALDDFGTGYSSLAYLNRFPVHIVKIDRSFVKDLPADESSSAIAAAVIAMAHALHKEVIAEGVATDEQIAFLERMKCDVIQGFRYSRPVAAEDFARFVCRNAGVERESHETHTA